MLHVGLLVLKIIGFVLLGIICLLLGFLLIVLLVPVRYRMEGSWHGALQGTARITWLLHILSVKVSYEKDGELATSVKLLGFRLFRDRADGEEVLEEGMDAVENTGRSAARVAEDEGAREDGETSRSHQTQEDPLIKQNLDSDDHLNRESGTGPDDDGHGEEWVTDNEEDSDMILQTQELGSEDDAYETDREYQEYESDRSADESTPKEGRISRLIKKIRRLISHTFRILGKFKFLFKSLCDKLKHIKDQYEAVLAFFQDESNQETMKLILRQVKALFRHILPRKVQGQVTFGFDDPYLTGQVLAGASLFYAWYGQKIDFIPVFEEPVLDGELKLKGRIRLGTLLWCCLRVYLNKNFRVLLKRWRNEGGIF